MKIKIFAVIFSFIIALISLQSFAQTALIDSTFNDTTLIDQVNSVAIDYSSEPGIIQLQTGENENLAKNRFAYVVYRASPPTDTARTRGQNLIDGNFNSPSFVEFPSQNIGGNNNNSYIIIDLQAFRTVNRVVIYTLFNPNLRPRAFTVFTGEDTLTMEKVYEELNNDDLNPDARFNPIVARFVKIVLNIIDFNNSTTITEIQVYGLGFLPQGTLYSSVRDLKRDVNFSTFDYEGNVPQNTEAAFAFRTGETIIVDSLWSNWSDYQTLSNSLFIVNEPRKYIQYRVRLTTSTLESPRIDLIKINYDTINVASATDASILPQFAPILKENEFSLTINTAFNQQDRGIDTLTIETPSPAELLSVTVNNNSVSYLPDINANRIILAFNSTVKTNSTFQIKFNCTPFLGISPFRIFASSKEVQYNPQQVDSKISNNVAAWSIVTIGVPERLIISTKVEPNPFTPNGDGRNDLTEIKFFLGNVGEPNEIIGGELRKLQIKIYDLTGRMIKNLFDNEARAFAFISSNSIQWDGRDEDGKVVRPGVYIYQISVDSDNGGEEESKTVVVSY